MIQLDLPVPPSTNKLYRNVPSVGRVKTKDYKSWEKVGGLSIISQGRPSIDGKYSISIRVHPDATKADIGNLEKPISDLLQMMGVIKNDRDCQKMVIFWSRNLPDMVDCRVLLSAWKKDD